MNKRFIGYVNIHKDKMTSLVLAEFDADKLSKNDKEIFDEWETGEASNVAEEILDSIKPYYYYYAIDFNDTIPFILINGEDPDGETWSSQCNNIYKKLHKAKQAVASGLNNNSIEKGIIKKIL